MKKNIIITGVKGFLGRHCARGFSEAGYSVYGIGREEFSANEFQQYGLEGYTQVYDIKPTVLCAAAADPNLKIDMVIHCAGGSSVFESVKYPALDFKNTVESTLAVLESIRIYSPETKLIYPSSTAVYGAAGADERISENRALSPVSPYGFHKAASELLCESYHKNYGVKCSIIRFFSLYGEGLKKQLLWDACDKIAGAAEGSAVEFFGTGNETRDWLHVSDAVGLMLKTAVSTAPFEVINGGSGIKTTVAETLDLIVKAFEKLGFGRRAIKFSGGLKPGDPAHYWADTARAEALGWSPRVAFADGVARYVEWFMRMKNNLNY